MNEHEAWLANRQYWCSCGHVEWAHFGTRLAKRGCMHCNCGQYNGVTRPLTEYEKKTGKSENDVQ